jgi:hypothetical protein
MSHLSYNANIYSPVHAAEDFDMDSDYDMNQTSAIEESSAMTNRCNTMTGGHGGFVVDPDNYYGQC